MNYNSFFRSNNFVFDDKSVFCMQLSLIFFVEGLLNCRTLTQKQNHNYTFLMQEAKSALIDLDGITL